jgi:predicted PurR-regulated permease PerM
VETLSEILKLVLYCSASAVCIYLIVVLVRFKVFLQVLQIELIDLNRNLKPILENLNAVTNKLRLITTKVEDQIDIIHGVFLAFRRITENITRLEEHFQQRLEEPLMRVGALFGNIINRVVSLFMRR